MSSSSLLLDIQLLYNQFTKTEKKIADYVAENANQVLFMSITDLADACNVADASVHRFCRAVGVKGYQEFKMKLSLSLTSGEVSERAEEEEKEGERKEFVLHNELSRLCNSLVFITHLESYFVFLTRQNSILF